jgi:hypothetical protein
MSTVLRWTFIAAAPRNALPNPKDMGNNDQALAWTLGLDTGPLRAPGRGEIA